MRKYSTVLPDGCDDDLRQNPPAISPSEDAVSISLADVTAIAQIVSGVGAGAAAIFAWKTVGSWQRERRLVAVLRMNLAAKKVRMAMSSTRSRIRRERTNMLDENGVRVPAALRSSYAYAEPLADLNARMREFEESALEVEALFPAFETGLADGMRHGVRRVGTELSIYVDIVRMNPGDDPEGHPELIPIRSVLYGDEQVEFGRAFMLECVKVTTWTTARSAELQRD